MKPTKTPLPARKQVILGFLYDLEARRIKSAPKKQVKYMYRIRDMLKKRQVSVTDILQIHGNLNYVAEVAPFGRPFLAAFTSAILGRTGHDVVVVSEAMKSALRIWESILKANTGVTFDFVLGKLPRCPNDIFVDASMEWGVGGV